MKSIISFTFAVSRFLLTLSLCKNYIIVVSPFTILESGQRIRPISRLSDDSPLPNSKNSHSKIEDYSHDANKVSDLKLKAKAAVKTTGLFDLPAIEKWAQFNNIKEHHIKTLYRVLLRQEPHNEHTSYSTINTQRNANDMKRDNQINGSFPPLLSLKLLTDLLESDFPHEAASSLFQQNSNKINNLTVPYFNTNFIPITSEIVNVRPSQSGGFKMVIRLQSGQMVETVIIRHDRSSNNNSNKDNKDDQLYHSRYTVCVSSQVGCARACTFCATGSMGLRGQLSSVEILEQIWHAKQYLSLHQQQQYQTKNTMKNNTEKHKQQQNHNQIKNVVFMGMGEPLDNYNAVLEACRGLTHQCLFGLKAKQVTISTVGATPQKIRWLAEDAPSISLALSLHGATRALREELIPSARRIQATSAVENNTENKDHTNDRYNNDESRSSNIMRKKYVDSLDELGEALDFHAKCTGRGVMIEYLLINGVNDSIDAADALGLFVAKRQKAFEKSLSNFNSKSKSKKVMNFVNLIPYNPTLAGDNFGYETPSDERIDSFCIRLRENFGVRALVRWSSAGGRDADGACGQLALTTSTS